MSAAWSDPNWGSWALGDMVSTLSGAADLLGASAEVDSVAVSPPVPPATLPLVQIKVTDTRRADRLRLEVTQGEFIAVFDDDSGDEWWAALVAGMRLEVSLSEVAS